MSTYVACPCGVSQDVCDYHKPEPAPQIARKSMSFTDAWIAQAYHTPLTRPGYNVGPLHAQPAAPTPGKPQATSGADGTHADDVVCTCGCYIVRKGKLFVDQRFDSHCEVSCMIDGNLIRSAAAKP